MNKSQKGFWPALERLAGGAVAIEWRGELGPDAESAWPLLRPANRLASTYPCTNRLGCECPHRIEELGPDRWLAVPGPDEGCAPIPLKREDLIVFEVDTAALCRGMAACLNLDVCGSRTVAGARAERIGRYGPSGWGAYLMVPGDSARMMREVDRLFNAHPDPFILLTPTGLHCSGDVESCLRRQLCMHIALRDIIDLGPEGKLTAKPSAGPLLAEFARRTAENKGLARTVEKIGRDIAAVAQGAYELRQENDELRQLQADGYLRFALRVDGEDFRAFAVIMALGTRKAAADFLGVPHRSFYDRVDKWPSRGKEYQKLARAVEWRKSVGRKRIVPLGDAMQSGDAGDSAANPETMKAALDRLRANEVDSRDYPALLGDILAALEALDAENWPAVRKELIGIIKEELLQ